MKILRPHFVALTAGLFLAAWAALASGANLRVVTYNIEADIDGATTARPGLATVLQAIGQQTVQGVTQQLDILALQETTSNNTTVAPLVASLNSIYGAGTYAMSTYQGKVVGNSPDTGNGPNALIYNATTLRLTASTGIGTPNGVSNGLYRQVVRYDFEPSSGGNANAFHVYVSHMKSSYNSVPATVQESRRQEAEIIRADAATLPTGASILIVGDFNLEGSTEPAYQALTTAGTGQVLDAMNVANNYAQTWNSSSTYRTLLTSSPTSLRYRTDIQFMSPNVYSGTAPYGLKYVSGSYRPFGNNGTTGVGDSVNDSSNTSLNNLSGPITPAQARQALTTASDHLPVVVDYVMTINFPPTVAVKGKKAYTTSKSQVTIKGTASDPDGNLAGVRVKVGTKPFKKAKGSANWKFKVKLVKGKNKLLIEALDTAGNTSVTVIRRVTRK